MENMGSVEDDYDDRDLWVFYPQPILGAPRVDLSPYVHRVDTQKGLRSCTASAVCSAYELNLNKQSHQDSRFHWVQFSRLFLYYTTRLSLGYPHLNTGANLRATIKAFNRHGVCVWPHTCSLFSSRPPDICFLAARGNSICRYARLEQTVDQLIACLLDSCPFVFGFSVFDNFSAARSCGTMRMPKSTSVLQGWHAVVAVGYDSSQQVFLILNSWGQSWGQRGYFRMPVAFTSWCHDFWQLSFSCKS